MLRYLLDRIPQLIWLRPIAADAPNAAGTSPNGLDTLFPLAVAAVPAKIAADTVAPIIAPTISKSIGRQLEPLAGPVADHDPVKVVALKEAPLVAAGVAVIGEGPVPHATVLVLKAAPASRMLAQRIASSRSMNCPKAIARRKRPAVSAMKPIRKRETAPVRQAKVRSQVAAPRVLIPARATAKILPFAGSLNGKEMAPSQIARVA